MTTRISESATPGLLWLAPMEGVMDATMRALITSAGPFDLCVTEFLRVVDELLPSRVFHRLCPELRENAGHTPSGVPLRLQLLGQNPEALALNAQRAVALGSHGVDLNFGCPAKTVNKSRGGAILLDEPETLYQIVRAVRAAVPAHEPVSAKMRLGFNDRCHMVDNARALEAGGAGLITVHARTRADSYRPPAYWECIPEIQAAVSVPVVANGEVWSMQDYQRCRAVTGVADIMVGRGALSLPNLGAVLKQGARPWGWDDTRGALCRLAATDLEAGRQRYMPGRIKQWLGYLRRQYRGAETLFQQIRRITDAQQLYRALGGDGNEPEQR